MIVYEIIAVFGYLTFGSNVSQRRNFATILLTNRIPVTGRRKHYCDVPFHLVVRCSWATGYRHPYHILLSAAGASVSHLLRQGFPRRGAC